MFIGAVASIILLVRMLLGMNQTYREKYFAVNGEPPLRSPLEPGACDLGRHRDRRLHVFVLTPAGPVDR